jgi:hypothetical protein
MKHNATQFEIVGTEHTFNLSGEIIRQDEAKQTTNDTTTGDLFAQNAEMTTENN